MVKMKIAHQPIIEKEKYLQFRLHDMWWGAWKKFGWPKGIPAIGISEKLIRYAFKVGKHIRVNTKWGNFEISPIKARREAKKWQSFYKARSGIKLLEIPRTAFTSVEKKKPTIIDRLKEEVRQKTINQLNLI